MRRINKNIYLVSGACHACIYNLNTRKLIPVRREDVSDLQDLFQNPMIDNSQTKRMIREAVIVTDEEYEQCETILLEKDSIEIAWIEVNTDCNFRCIHCYVDGERHRTANRRITYADFCLAVDRIREYGIRRIHIIGGEPLLHPDFMKMMQYALPKFECSVLLTNGFFLNQEMLEILKSLGLSEVDLSLYSTIEEEHEKVTLQKGSFRRTMEAVRMVEDSGLTCHIATVRVPGIDIGEPYRSSHPNAAVQHFDYMRASGRGLDTAKNTLVQNNGKMITADIVNRNVDPQKILYKMRFHNCFGRYVRINPDLDVFPCTMEQRISHGNIRENSIENILKESIRRLNKDRIEGCCQCEFRYICSDCRPDTMFDHIYEKPWFCTYDPVAGIWAQGQESPKASSR